MFAGDRPGKAVYAEILIPIKSGTYAIFRGRYEAYQGQVAIFRLTK